MSREMPTKLSVLLEQRQVIVRSIFDDKKSFHSACFTSVTFATALFAYFSTEELVISSFWFYASQAIFLLACFFYFLLTDMNQYRDLVRAIDERIKEDYGIDVYFLQGNLAYELVSRLGNIFSNGILVIVLTIYFGIWYLCFSWFFPLIKDIWNGMGMLLVVFELVFLGWVMAQNLRYGYHGKSKHYNAAKDFLAKSKMDIGEPLNPDSGGEVDGGEDGEDDDDGVDTIGMSDPIEMVIEAKTGIDTELDP